MFLINKKAYVIFLILIISIFIQLFAVNYDYFKKNLIYGSSLESQSLDLSKAVLTNIISEASNKYISQSNDPQVEFKQVNKKTYNIEMNITYVNSGATLQVFYTDDINHQYNEEHSIKILTSNKQEKYIINFDKPINLENLRVDVTERTNDLFLLNSITLNKKGFHFNFIKFLLINLGLAFIYLIIIFFKKYNEMLFNYRYQITLLVFILLVLFKFQGSSIGLWDSIMVNTNKETHSSTTLIGKARDIRSDEFLVHTPWVLAQNQNDQYFPIVNKNIGSNGHSMIALNAPTFSPDIIGKPYFWGFLLLGKDFGLSWYWNFKLLMLLLLSLEISYFLTKNKLLSFLGGLWITLSPAIQWWFDTPAAVVELIILAQGMIVSLIYFIEYYRSTKLRTLFIILFTMSTIGFTTLLYPPVQVSLGYLVLVFLFFIYWGNKEKFVFNKQELWVGSACFFLLVISISTFIYFSYDDLKLLSQTKYPGDRFATGGRVDVNELQTYLVNWVLPYKDVNFSNSSELSSFVNFLPLLILVFFYVYRFEQHNKRLIMGIFTYLLFQISWLFIEYPKFFAKVTLYSYVTEKRLAYLILGLTAVYLSLWLISTIQKHKTFNSFEKISISFIIGVIYLYSIWHTPMLKYLTTSLAIITVIYFVCLNYLILSGKVKSFFLLLLVLIVISGLSVNPISRGTASIYDKPVVNEILQLNKKYPHEKWAAVNSIYNGQLLVALGLNTFNSVHFFPDISMWKKLDEENKYEDVYNRYAHVLFYLTKEKTNFKLMQLDAIQANINFGDLPKTGISLILSKGSLNEFESKLERLYFDDLNDLYIYRLYE
ncbi:DUF7657 domain-containing protein [Paenibacillus sp. Root444D2]|uniref:DUF7657 domain-containing protein n=1 Tax=Paenibacillus sp. Root444D2 TaxID=1736538 RepID=UPI00070BB4B6|nr:hypothetical protein [Paenibacillus sp. Root444D2]KQX51919.1 hypothetical protein ASD40_07565 [Paenibacillus sp. Root444D2]